jgi:hypothetical protein
MRQNRSIQLTPGIKNIREASGSHFKHEGDVQDFGYATSNAVCNRSIATKRLILNKFQSENFEPQNMQAEKELLDSMYVRKSHEVLLLKKCEGSQAAEFDQTCQEMSLMRAELEQRESEKAILQHHNVELKEKLTELELNDKRSKEELQRLKSVLKTSKTGLAQLSEL